MRVSGISSGFPGLSQSEGQVAHVLRTRSPLIAGPKSWSPFDLHVLSTPPAFVLSQDQTLRRDIGSPSPKVRGFAILIWSRPTLVIPPVMSGRIQYNRLRVDAAHQNDEPRLPSDGV